MLFNENRPTIDIIFSMAILNLFVNPALGLNLDSSKSACKTTP